MKTCEFQECQNKHDSHGYCANHARQYRKYGHPLSKEEIFEKRSKLRKGNTNNLGKTWKVKDTSKMKGRHPRSEFKKGTTPWNKGTIGLIKAWNKGKKMPSMVGENNPNWKGGITTDDRKERVRFRKTVQMRIFARDNYTCQVCDEYGANIHVDHIKSWAEYPELRFEESNCRTLCMACHYYVTFKRKIPKGIIWGNNLSRRIG